MVRSKKQQRKQRLQRRILAAVTSTFFGLLIAGLVLRDANIPVLDPAGPIAFGQRQLLITAFLLMLIIVLPVFAILFLVAWRYRETNTKATYRPDWDHSRLAETVWWVVPGLLISVLGVLTWRGTFQYDPYKPLAIQADTLKVQVVALDWRWLFIYPDQGVASINELYMPVKKAVQFDITADAPMNSFWIPQLGGQIYAMPGMGTRLHLSADKIGSYYGSSANISGEGFSGMNFQAKAMPQTDFDNWVTTAKRQAPLSRQTYDALAKPSTDKTVKSFGTPADGLYESVIMKYMNMDHASSSHQTYEVSR